MTNSVVNSSWYSSQKFIPHYDVVLFVTGTYLRLLWSKGLLTMTPWNQKALVLSTKETSIHHWLAQLIFHHSQYYTNKSTMQNPELFHKMGFQYRMCPCKHDLIDKHHI